MARNGIICEVHKQGGGWVPGLAIARKGSQLLIQYFISNGEPRWRWFRGDRYRGLERDVSELPRYVSRSCRKVTFDEPVVVGPVQLNEHGSVRRSLPEDIRWCPLCNAERGTYNGKHLPRYGFVERSSGDLHVLRYATSYPWVSRHEDWKKRKADLDLWDALTLDEQRRRAAEWDLVVLSIGGRKLSDARVQEGDSDA